MRKIGFAFGTRPEAIKMCPVVREMRKREGFLVRVCVTGQHREMLFDALRAFDVVPDCNLDVMREGQSLTALFHAVLSGMTSYLRDAPPDLLLVHGDTASAFAAALAAFYLRIPVGHVEAGLRTYDTENPYPEEFHRRAIALLARYHFAPTERARENLLRERIPEESVFVTGNTVLDALKSTVKQEYTHPLLAGASRLILLTCHRRENLGVPMKAIFSAVRRVCEEKPTVRVIYPMHPNPFVREIAEKAFKGCENILMTEPLGVYDFHNLLARSTLVLTDSGGVQEEAVALGRPTLVLRTHTERMEGVDAKVLRLIGTDEKNVYENFRAFLENHRESGYMVKNENPFGDGRASERIANVLERELL